jgi:hypothetical protein
MNKFALFVTGPAGVGKSTFCRIINDHYTSVKREEESELKSRIFNMDPAVYDGFDTNLSITKEFYVMDIMEKYKLSLHGGIMKSFECLLQSDFLERSLSNFTNELLFVDCPGQIELYIHSPHMKHVMNKFKENDYTIAMVYLTEHWEDESRNISTQLNCLSTFIRFEMPSLRIIVVKDDDNDKEDDDDDDDDDDDIKSNDGTLCTIISDLMDNYQGFDYLDFQANDNDSITSIIMYINRILGIE